jgi:polysaccharide export outer membrane protein
MDVRAVIMLNLLLSFILLSLQAASGQGQTAAPAPLPPRAPDTTYVVGATDVLNIQVLGEADMTKNYTVDSDGTITFPYLQRVPVSGRTLKEIETLLTKLLSDGYVNKPQVSASVANYRSRSVFVLGQVKSPARYTIEGQTTLLELIANAGSFSADAGPTLNVLRYKDGIMGVAAGSPVSPGDPRAAEILRVNIDDLREGRLQANIILQDGDTIFVPAADRFYVTGFVRTPGSYILRPGMTVQQAIAEAGGFTERGSTRGLKIIRKVNGKDAEINAKMSDLVRPNDTVKVRQRLI